VFSNWKKASYSEAAQQCVEVSTTPARVGVRDTKNRAQGHLSVRTAAWKAFVSSVTR